MSLRYRVAVRSDVGQRERQEDSSNFWRADDDPAARDDAIEALAVVADGMGGHAGGDVAGRLACDVFLETFLEDGGRIRDALLVALEASNTAISEEVEECPDLDGMGCTIIAACLTRNELHWISVGDSLLLLFRDGQL